MLTGKAAWLQYKIVWCNLIYFFLQFLLYLIHFCIAESTRLFFSEYPAMGVHPLLLEWHGSAIGGLRRAFLKDSIDCLHLVEAWRAFQSILLSLEKKQKLVACTNQL